MTIEELQAQRDKILKRIAQPQSGTGPGGMGFTNPSQDDNNKALAAIDAEIARLQGGESRTFTIQTNRGI
jgi:hypothetical protein